MQPLCYEYGYVSGHMKGYITIREVADSLVVCGCFRSWLIIIVCIGRGRQRLWNLYCAKCDPWQGKMEAVVALQSQLCVL